MKKETNSTPWWGFSRKDLEKYNVALIVDVALKWDKKTPVNLRKAFGEASHVLLHLANGLIHAQLAMDGLEPTTIRNFIYGWGPHDPRKRKHQNPVPIRQQPRAHTR